MRVWTLIAALVGGSLLGLFGMIFFIPLASVLYTLLDEFTTWRLGKKKIVIEDGYESFPDGGGEQVSFDFGEKPEEEKKPKFKLFKKRKTKEKTENVEK